MKKIYTLLFTALILASAVSAQRVVSSSVPFKYRNPTVAASSHNQSSRVSSVDDTLAGEFGGTASLYGSQGGGFVSGQNGYGDLSKMQLFDATYGVTGAGVITGILFYMGWVEGNPNSFITATIWDDNAGTPGTILGTVNVPYSSMDTTGTGYTAISTAPGPDPALFNAVAVFSTPIAIPASLSFFAGFSFTYAAGDTVGLFTTTDPTGGDAPGVSGDFADATTHTWEEWSDNTLHSFNAGSGTWQLDIAQGIFPTVSFGVGVQEPAAGNGLRLNQNVPNPAVNETMISYSLEKSANVTFTVADMTGKIIEIIEKGNQTSGKHQFMLNTRSISSGVYFVSMNADGTSINNRLVVSK